jgi:GNAT superfamily N-acetyltransferase
MVRPYEHDRDRDACCRIWREVGWLDAGKEDQFDHYIDGSQAFVADLEGQAEAMTLVSPGVVRYLDEELPFTGVTGVTTSHIARGRGLATHLTARALSEAAAGALVAGLGMFEQGFYNRLGFGTGTYERQVGFDPASLQVPRPSRAPKRVAATDWQAAHAARLARRSTHGRVNILPPGILAGDLAGSKNGFGLGYMDGPAGELSHFLWLEADDLENGPYSVLFSVFRTGDEFKELLGVLRGLGDQVRLIRMPEPPDIQMQDLIREPFRQAQTTRNTRWDSRINCSAHWQARICDLPGCLANTHLDCALLRFNLQLADPVVDWLPLEAPWRGVGGEYVITLARQCEAVTGNDPSLPTLTADVGAFTRLWLGVRAATGLAITDHLAGPRSLLDRLDRCLRLPEPLPDWDY